MMQGRIFRGGSGVSVKLPALYFRLKKVIFMGNLGYICDTVFILNIHTPYFLLFKKSILQPTGMNVFNIAG